MFCWTWTVTYSMRCRRSIVSTHSIVVLLTCSHLVTGTQRNSIGILMKRSMSMLFVLLFIFPLSILYFIFLIFFSWICFKKSCLAKWYLDLVMKLPWLFCCLKMWLHQIKGPKCWTNYFNIIFSTHFINQFTTMDFIYSKYQAYITVGLWSWKVNLRNDQTKYWWIKIRTSSHLNYLFPDSTFICMSTFAYASMTEMHLGIILINHG